MSDKRKLISIILIMLVSINLYERAIQTLRIEWLYLIKFFPIIIFIILFKKIYKNDKEDKISINKRKKSFYITCGIIMYILQLFLVYCKYKDGYIYELSYNIRLCVRFMIVILTIIWMYLFIKAYNYRVLDECIMTSISIVGISIFIISTILSFFLKNELEITNIKRYDYLRSCFGNVDEELGFFPESISNDMQNVTMYFNRIASLSSYRGYVFELFYELDDVSNIQEFSEDTYNYKREIVIEGNKVHYYFHYY